MEKGNQSAGAAVTPAATPSAPKLGGPITPEEKQWIITNELAQPHPLTREMIEERLAREERTKGPEMVRLGYALKYPPGTEVPGAGPSPWYH